MSNITPLRAHVTREVVPYAQAFGEDATPFPSVKHGPLDFKVVSRTMLYWPEEGVPMDAVTSAKLLVKASDPSIQLAVVGKDYKVIQNHELIARI